MYGPQDRGTRAERGVAAAVAVAEAHGLPVSRAVVLRALSSVVLRLEPHPLVVRAAVSGTGSLRPGGLARTVREARVATHLAAAGAPSAVPSPLLRPGPHVQGGAPLVVLARLPHDPLRPLPGPALGATLRDVHEALVDYDGPLPRLPHLEETRGWLVTDELRRALPARLRARMTATVAVAQAWLPAAGLPVRPVHGDAHSGNALLGEHGPRWADLEDACLGPVEWDLACLVTTARVFGGDLAMAEAALAAYGEHDEETLAVLVAARAVMVAAWAWLQAAADPRRERIAVRRTAELASFLAGGTDPGTGA